MTLVRKKLSKSNIILLALIAIFLVALPILHFTGAYPLDFLGDYAIAAAMTATTSGWIAGAMAIGCGVVGFGICYILKDYIIGIEGNNLSVTNTGSNYTPLGTNPAPTSGGTAVNP
jgi:hypothetical protein